MLSILGLRGIFSVLATILLVLLSSAPTNATPVAEFNWAELWVDVSKPVTYTGILCVPSANAAKCESVCMTDNDWNEVSSLFTFSLS